MKCRLIAWRCVRSWAGVSSSRQNCVLNREGNGTPPHDAVGPRDQRVETEIDLDGASEPRTWVGGSVRRGHLENEKIGSAAGQQCTRDRFRGVTAGQRGDLRIGRTGEIDDVRVAGGADPTDVDGPDAIRRSENGAGGFDQLE